MKGRRKRGGRRRSALGATEPLRTCVGCRNSAPRQALLRFVRAPDGAVAFDVRAALPGRGAWTCPNPSCVERAITRGGFRRAFEQPLLVEEEALLEEVQRVLLGECQRMLGLLRRTGSLFPGRGEAFRQVAASPSAALIVAADLAPRSVREAEQATARPLLIGPSKVEIGEALGRRPTGVLAVTDGPSLRRLAQDLSRLARLRGTPSQTQEHGAAAQTVESAA